MSDKKRRTPNAAYVHKNPEVWKLAGWTSIPNSVIRDSEMPPDEIWAFAWLASHTDDFEVSGRALWEANQHLGRNRAYELLSALERRGLLLRRRVYDEHHGVPYVQYELQPTPVPEEERTWVPPRAKARERVPHPGSKAARAVQVEPAPHEGIPGRAGIPSELDFPALPGSGGTSRQGGSRQGGNPYKEEKTMEKITNQPGPGAERASPPSAGSPGWLDGQPPPQQAAASPSAGVQFLDRLDVRYRPDAHAIRRLAPKVEQLLAGGWSEQDLLRRLTGNIDGVHNPPGVVVRRLTDLPLPKGVSAPEKPPWCGECDERTRQRETPDDRVERCPRCHPQRAVAPPAAS